MTVNVGARLDWSRTSQDYARHRRGYPDSFFKLLPQLGVGLPGQNILDLGSGTGVLAIPFSRAGAHVTAVDAAPGQIAAARERAAQDNLDIRFIISGAEEVDVEEAHFHAVTASMCWGYFDKERVVPLVKRALRPGGLLMISSAGWISGYNDITRETEALIGRYHPHFVSRGGRHESVSPEPEWAKDGFRTRTFHHYVEGIPFTREAWRGRIRASKWIGAALPREEADSFDRELAGILERIAPERFEIAHNIRIRIFERTE
ncbi:MAG TPA: class I SAM-dependent methyltransferase [Desulfuromonadaceae bacterium]